MKKRRFVALIRLAMKITVVQLFVLVFVFSSSAKVASGQEILEKTISLSVDKAKLKSVLHDIQYLADVQFVFSSVMIDANRKITIAAKDKKLGDLLKEIGQSMELGYRVIDDQIILFSNPQHLDLNAGSTIHGVVSDEYGGPLAGATVRVKGTNISTITDPKGVFVLEQVPENSTLIISYIGYNPTEIVVTGKPDYNVKLRENNNSLNSVIVIGYGTAKKKDVVGAVDVISVRTAGANTSTNASELLIGKAAGVQVVQTNGTPGADAQIIIRGTGSFTNVDPLYVIDGIQGDKNMFNSIAAQDIDNITILKDAASTAIYGVGGANGVVLVTTKKARTGAPRISFLSQWGISQPWKQMDLLNSSQYVQLLKDFAATGNQTLPAKFNQPGVLVDSNDWQNNIFQNGLYSENDISLSGGTEKVLYTFSAGYLTQRSIIRDYGYKRFTTRFSLDERLGIFHFGQSLNIRYQNTTGQMAALSDAIQYAPYKPIFDPSVLGGYSIVTNVDDFNNTGNPMQAYSLNTTLVKDITLFPQLFGEVDLVKGLKFRTQFSGEIQGGQTNTYSYAYTASNNLSNPRKATLSYYNTNTYVWENYFNYDGTFGKNNIAVTVGTSYISPGNTSYMQGTGSNYPNDVLQNISAAPTQALTSSNVNYAQASVISYFGRLIYTFDGKYILSASMRRDGASNFGSNNQWGSFPGVGVAWKFGDENFMRQSLPFITDGKLRAGWGRTGNNHIANFLTTPLLFSGSPAGNLDYSFGTAEPFNNGITITSVANPDLRWETTDQTDIGIDLAFLNNHLTFTADWYQRKSSGLLVSVPLPASVGISSPNTQPQKTTNAADAQNTGFEFSVGYQSTPKKDFSFNVNANLAYNENKVNSLGSQFTAPIKAGQIAQLSTFTITQPGSPIGSFYGYKLDHVAKDQAEIDALNTQAQKATGNPAAVYQSGLLPGDFIFKDINHSGAITDSDQAVLGNPIPKFVYGFSAGMTYKAFDLNLVISGVAGVNLLNSNKFYTQIEATGHNSTTAILNRWRNPGDVAALPRAGQSVTANGNLRASDWWMESGDYLRIRNLTIGYTISKSALNSFSGNVLTKVRFFIAAQNLLTITKYSGYDPEISYQTNGGYIFQRGIDDNQPPQPRTFLAGVQLGF